MDKNSHFKVNTEQPLKLVGMVVKPNGKNLKIITLLGTQEHSRLRLKHLVVPIISVPGFKELESTTHLCLYNHY